MTVRMGSSSFMHVMPKAPNMILSTNSQNRLTPATDTLFGRKLQTLEFGNHILFAVRTYRTV